MAAVDPTPEPGTRSSASRSRLSGEPGRGDEARHRQHRRRRPGPGAAPRAATPQAGANLTSLGTDRLDVVYLRRLDFAPGIIAEGDQKADIDAQLAELAALREAGKIHSIAVSNVDAGQLRHALPAGFQSRPAAACPAASSSSIRRHTATSNRPSARQRPAARRRWRRVRESHRRHAPARRRQASGGYGPGRGKRRGPRRQLGPDRSRAAARWRVDRRSLGPPVLASTRGREVVARSALERCPGDEAACRSS